jgi:hypothetical protein
VATSAQAEQAALTVALTDALEQAWPMLDIEALKHSMPEWQQAVAGIVTQLATASAVSAGDHYTLAREAADIRSAFRPILAQPPSVDYITTKLDIATQGLWSRSLDDEAVTNVKTLVEGVTQELIADAGRDTTVGSIEADAKALGWARVARPTCCAFCRMLAGRGAAYKSKRTAELTETGTKYHPHCHCLPMPIFSPDALLPEHNQQWADEWKQVTKGLSGRAARIAWRRFVENREQ